MDFLVVAIIGLLALLMGFYLSRLAKRKLFDKEFDKLKDGSFLGQALSKKQKKFIVIAPLSISLVFVILYFELSAQTFVDFVKYGLISIIPNLLVTTVIFYLDIERMLNEVGGSYLIIFVYILSLIIPFFTYFVLIAVLFAGFQVPFKY